MTAKAAAGLFFQPETILFQLLAKIMKKQTSMILYILSNLLGFAFELAKRVFGIGRKTALAIKSKTLAIWEFEIPPLGQFTTARGAEWGSYSKGNWHLVESNGVETESAVSELLDFLGFPFGMFQGNIEEKTGFLSILATSVELGLTLPVEYIKQTYCGEKPKSNVGPSQHAEKASKNSKPSEASQDRVNAYVSLCSLQPSVNHGVGPVASDVCDFRFHWDGDAAVMTRRWQMGHSMRRGERQRTPAFGK